MQTMYTCTSNDRLSNRQCVQDIWPISSYPQMSLSSPLFLLRYKCDGQVEYDEIENHIVELPSTCSIRQEKACTRMDGFREEISMLFMFVRTRQKWLLELLTSVVSVNIIVFGEKRVHYIKIPHQKWLNASILIKKTCFRV